MKSLSRLSVNSLRLFTIFEEEKVLDVIDDDQSSEHRQLGNINQSHCYSLFLVDFFKFQSRSLHGSTSAYL